MNIGRRAFEVSALAALFAVGIVGAASSTAQINSGVDASYSLESSTLTLHEPVRLIFTITNNSIQTINVDLGRDRTANFAFVLTRPDGTEEQLPELKPPVGMFKKGRFAVAPGNGLTQTLLLNERTEFSKPGRYGIRTHLRSPVTTEQGAKLLDVPTHHATFEILPRNEARLVEVCERLVNDITSSASALDSDNAALALSYIQDPIAVPFMEKALRSEKTPGRSLAQGLVQLGSASAARAMIAVYTEVSASRPEANTWNRTRLNVIHQALQSLETNTSDPGIKQEIRRALER